MPTANAAAADRATEFTAKVKPLLQKYCYECHGDGNTAGELDLDQFKSHANVMSAKPTWAKVIRYAAHAGDAAARGGDSADAGAARCARRALCSGSCSIPTKPDPGRVTIRRLNRTEYRNTIRDLLGVGFDPTIDFPQDDTGYGFDNIADVLTLPPMLMEKYLVAAEKILDEAMPTDQRRSSVERHVAATEAAANFEPRRAHVARRLGERCRAAGGLRSSSRDDCGGAGRSTSCACWRTRSTRTCRRPDSPSTRRCSCRSCSATRSCATSRCTRDHERAEVVRGARRRAGRAAVSSASRCGGCAGRSEDRNVSDGRVGVEQPGDVHVKEIHHRSARSAARCGASTATGSRSAAAPAACRKATASALHATDDQAIATIDVPADGKYLLRAQAYAEYAGDEHAKMELLLDDKPLKTFDVAAPAALKTVAAAKELGNRAPPRRAARLRSAGDAESRASTSWRRGSSTTSSTTSTPDPNYRDRNLYVQHFEVVELSAPPLSPPMTEPMRRLFAKHAPAAKDAGVTQARALLQDFTRRAWRRPPQTTTSSIG